VREERLHLAIAPSERGAEAVDLGRQDSELPDGAVPLRDDAHELLNLAVAGGDDGGEVSGDVMHLITRARL